jgi:hypothetical protein
MEREDGLGNNVTMTFVQASMDVPTMVSTIVQALAATDDFTMIDTAATDNNNSTGYCLQHTPTGQYITLITGYGQGIDQNGDFNYRSYNQIGMRVIISSAYDTTNHKPDTTQNYTAGLVSLYNGNRQDVAALISPNVFSTALWIDKYGVIGTIQNTYTNGIGVFFALEFFPQNWVEYDDAQEPIVFYCKRSSDEWAGNNPIDMSHSNYQSAIPRLGWFYMRPYRYYNQTYAANGDVISSINQHEGAFIEREAFRSVATNKVYIKFCKYENDKIAARMPYAETRRWIKTSITGGLQIGDIVNWIDPDAVTVHKFIVTVATAGQMYFMIPYENAFDYATGSKT